MKSVYAIAVISFALLLTACEQRRIYNSIIDRAESISKTYPDSALALLESIPIPEELKDAQLARWCMLYGQIADSLFEEMPYVSQLTRASNYYKKQGTPAQQAQIGLYLGRSYVEDKEYRAAMQAYMPALDIALKAREYNLAGYLCSYMGDLHNFEDTPLIASEKYKEAAKYFLKANNKRSYAFALRDVGCMYTMTSPESCRVALTYLQKADTVVGLLKDSDAISSVYNGLGNVYSMLGETSLAENYILESINLDSFNNAPNYLSLAAIMTNVGNIDKAYRYLQKATVPTYNEDTPTGIILQYYKIAKKENDTNRALYYLEQYKTILDSVVIMQNKVNILDTEKKYNHLKVINENINLKISMQYYIIIVTGITLLIVIILLVYQIHLKHKNKQLYEQQEKLSLLDFKLLQSSVELEKKEKELMRQTLYLTEQKKLLTIQGSLNEQEQLYQQRNNEIETLKKEMQQLKIQKLQSSPVVKKMITLSIKRLPNMTNSLLTNKDWLVFTGNVNEIYPTFSSKLLDKLPEATLEELHYCYFSILDLDIKSESILLGITPDAVNKRRTRLRQKLGITGKSLSLHAYITNMID